MIYINAYMELIFFLKRQPQALPVIAPALAGVLNAQDVDVPNKARLSTNVASAYEEAGDLARAAEYFLKAYEYCKADVPFESKAVTAHEVADFYSRQHKKDKALPLLLESREHAKKMLETATNDSQRRRAVKLMDWSALNLASHYRQNGDDEKALRILREEERIWKETGMESDTTKAVRDRIAAWSASQKQAR